MAMAAKKAAGSEAEAPQATAVAPELSRDATHSTYTDAGAPEGNPTPGTITEQTLGPPAPDWDPKES